MCKFRKIQENNKNLEKFRKIQKNLEMRPAGSGEMQREFGNALAGSGKLQKNFRDATGRFRQNSYKFRNAPAGSGKSQRNSFDFVPACSKMIGICNKFKCAPCRWDCAKRTSRLVLIPSAFFATGLRRRDGKISMPHS